MEIEQIKATNAAKGYHWFEASTLRFFLSRIGRTVYEGPGGIYFVSSEQFEASSGERAPRRYTVRSFNPETGNINTVGQFNQLSRGQAVRLAKHCAVNGDGTKGGQLRVG